MMTPLNSKLYTLNFLFFIHAKQEYYWLRVPVLTTG